MICKVNGLFIFVEYVLTEDDIKSIFQIQMNLNFEKVFDYIYIFDRLNLWEYDINHPNDIILQTLSMELLRECIFKAGFNLYA